MSERERERERHTHTHTHTERVVLALKNDITPPLLRHELGSPETQYRAANLIPSSLLIFTLLGGYVCGVGFSDKRATVFRMSSASHIRLGPPPQHLSLLLSLFFGEKETHSNTNTEKRKGVSICQNIDLSSSHASFGPNGKCGKRGKRAPIPRKKERQKITMCSFNFENMGFFSTRQRP